MNDLSYFHVMTGLVDLGTCSTYTRSIASEWNLAWIAIMPCCLAVAFKCLTSSLVACILTFISCSKRAVAIHDYK